MVTGELKNKIDGIWNIFWSGGITNPLTVIEQITYLMFIKILDDNEKKKKKNAAFFEVEVIDPVFDAEHQNCRWSNFRNMEAQAMFDNMRDNVFPFITGTGKEEGKGLSEGKDTAFKRFMKNAIFLIPSPKMLVSVVQGIEGLDLEDKDIMGDVYEYLLSQITQSGTNGQFRTPRHIIKMMVRLMEPTLEDDICDPAMGTAGFICAAAEYLQENYKTELLKTENRRHFVNDMFTGFDTDQTMLRIGAMNMMLHGVEAPQITWLDSLSEDNTHRDRYSLIMANPPLSLAA